MAWFRILSLVFLTACVWVGIEIYEKGTERAFDGAFAVFGDEEGSEVSGRRTAPQRAGDVARNAHRIAAERRDRLLGE